MVQDSDTQNVPNGSPFAYNKSLSLDNGTVGIQCLTVVNNTSLIISVFPNAQQPAGSGIPVPAGASVTIPIANYNYVYVSASGTNTIANAFFYLHWIDSFTTSFATNVTPTNVTVSNSPNVTLLNSLLNVFPTIPTAGTAVFQAASGAPVTNIYTVPLGKTLFITDLFAYDVTGTALPAGYFIGFEGINAGVGTFPGANTSLFETLRVPFQVAAGVTISGNCTAARTGAWGFNGWIQ